MGIVTIAAAAVTAAVFAALLRKTNPELSLILVIACSVVLLLWALASASGILENLNSMITSAGLRADYIAILLKVIGICLVTEFAVNVCRDSGSSALAGNLSLAGKLLITLTAMPLYNDIFQTILSLLQR